MGDSVPSLELIADCAGVAHSSSDARDEFELLIFTYSRHHDPAVKAAREAMEKIIASEESYGYATGTSMRLRSALRLLDGKVVPHE